ncbi:MAG: hypothetical protein P0Y56_00490 [Candidatus Andeanibacterium colombiense]|uniref:YbjN domain-containing protein n=1 Tax=Candidatus Andeanibacterium colombiense TaxID=3121345 RepID=A0AAJ5X306_9SPHN|nr:MAG: hypothetical protein P0Y56_00490 [Sphingomonadaceae bacterium]
MNRLTAALLCGALVLVLAPAPAFAATVAGSSKDAKIFRSVTEQDLTEVVTGEGHAVDEAHPFDAPSVQGKTADGLIFVLMGTDCDVRDVPGCQGIMMQVRYDSDESVTIENVNQANLDEAAIATWWDKENETVGFTRYMVLDGGVTWLNIRQNLRVLLSVHGTAVDDVFP